MNPKWKTFLEKNGAQFSVNSNTQSDNDEVIEQLVYFNSPENETKISSQDLLLCNPSERGLIKVHGADAESFLQNQFTNDIRNVNDVTHQESAWCSPKGRIIANFTVFKRDDSFYLALSRDLVTHVMKKLGMYVMMSKVVIEDVSDALIHFTFAGKDADSTIKDLVAIPSSEDVAVIQDKSSIFLRSQIAATESKIRFDIFVEDIDEAKTIWNKCKELALPVSGAGIRYLNIISGKPEITSASSEAWIPQMVNYTHINGVDFKKGCYPGQEVVARLNYLGKTKRRMYRLQIDTDQLPEVGATIKSEKDSEAGKILSAVLNAENTIDALAVLKIANAENPLTLATNDATITILDLPYGVDDE